MGAASHHHHHGHHHGHAHVHAPSADADRRWLAVALALIAGFMGVEVAAGLLAGSLALLSDAAHMLTDAAAIGLALVAARLAARPARGAFTFGLGRAEILSAQSTAPCSWCWRPSSPGRPWAASPTRRGSRARS
jgi:cobalt-zinc-cadmium efflux system protein